MKKNVFWMLAAILTCGLMMTSCSIDDNAAGADGSKGKKLTILYYAYGGANLDHCLLENIKDMYQAGDASVYDQLNICVQYKNSAIFEVDESKKRDDQYFLNLIQESVPGFKFEKGTTYRFLLDPKKGYSKKNPQMQLTDDNIYGGKGNTVNMGDDNTLLDFIKWAKENYPAENYMLILNDHGGGYMPHDDQPKTISGSTRGVVYDDGFDDDHLMVPGIANALKQSGIKFQAIYFEVCMMNNLEYLYEMSDYTDYVMASTYVAPGNGGDYKTLYRELATNSNFEQAIKNYYEALNVRWTDNDNPDAPSYDDNTLTKTADLINGAPAIKAFVDQLCDSYMNGDDSLRAYIDAVTANTFKVNKERPYYDMSNYLTRIRDNAKIQKADEKLSDAAFEAFRAVVEPIVAQAASYYTDVIAAYHPGYSVLMGQEGQYYLTKVEDDKNGVSHLTGYIIYTWDGSTQMYGWDETQSEYVATNEVTYWGSTGAATYEQLKFDKLTGWSRWLKLNKQFPNFDTVTAGKEWDDSYVRNNVYE